MEVGGLGGVEVAPEPVDFALFVEAAVGGHPVAAEGEVLRGFGRVDRLGPGAVQPVQLGPVHLALAAEGHQVLLRVAPPVQRPRPLVGAVQVEGQMAGFDHCAVDDPGGDRGDFPDRDGNHGFVEQGQAVVELAQHDLCLPEAQRTEGRRVSVATCPSEVGGPGEGFRGGGAVALVEGAQPGRDGQQALEGAGLGQVLDDPVGAGEPAGAAGRFAQQDEVHPGPDGAAGGGGVVAVGEVLQVRPGQDVHSLGAPAGEDDGGGQLFQIAGRKFGVVVGSGVLPDGVRPAPFGVGFPAVCECRHRVSPFPVAGLSLGALPEPALSEPVVGGLPVICFSGYRRG